MKGFNKERRRTNFIVYVDPKKEFVFSDKFKLKNVDERSLLYTRVFYIKKSPITKDWGFLERKATTYSPTKLQYHLRRRA